MFKIMICESTFKIKKKIMTQKNVALYYNVIMYITTFP
jgi:DNA modification methylase